MEIRCLGRVDIEIDKWKEILNESLQKIEDEESRGMFIKPTASFKLGGNYYVPITDENKPDNSRERCDVILKESREQPQRIGKVKERETLISGLSIDYEMINHIWLHDGKIYLLYRNDYDYEQVRLLILDYIDREKKRFESLKQKFKKK